MEIKSELKKPYTDKERMNFIVEQNHKNGYTIEETDNALLAWGLSNEEKETQKQERILMLSLTAADVERGIYKAIGKDFDDVLSCIEAQPVSENTPTIDIKALKIELKANNFYRGNSYVDTIGTMLGFSKEQLDDFFETNDYTKLLK